MDPGDDDGKFLGVSGDEGDVPGTALTSSLEDFLASG